MTYEKLDGASYTDLHRRLLNKRLTKFRTGLLTALRTNAGFVEWMRKEVEESPGERLPPAPERLTESEFQKPPEDTELRLFKAWQKVTPADACRAAFWGCVTLRHIEQDRIDAHYLAANGASRTGGRERIEQAVRDGGEKEIDGAVRAVLRRLSGLPERGNRSVYVDCPFARAWWRQYVAEKVRKASTDRADRRAVLRVLNRSQDYWERLINLVVSRNSVLGDTKVRSALIWAITEKDSGKDGAPRNGVPHPVFSGTGLSQVIRQIGIRSAWQELGVFSVYELKDLMEREFLSEAAPAAPEHHSVRS